MRTRRIKKAAAAAEPKISLLGSLFGSKREREREPLIRISAPIKNELEAEEEVFAG